MIPLRAHERATCSACDEQLLYGTKEEASSWKVYYECGDRCGWEAMVGIIALSDIDHRDEVDERAEQLGDRWA